MSDNKDFEVLYAVCEENEVHFDSRSCVEGSVFFALRGAKTDGHSYLEEVRKRGADFAVIEEGYTGPTYGLTCFRVSSPLATMHLLAKEVIARNSLRVVAITGSCGKTTTKEYIAAMLSVNYDVVKTPGSRNSQVGLPAFILTMRKDADLYVFEMGMTAIGEIQKLTEIAPPEIAVITMIGRAHIGYLGSQENIARAKGEILHSPQTKRAFLGTNLKRFPEVISKGVCEKTFIEPRFFDRCAHLPHHLHENITLALAVASYFGIEEGKALRAIDSVVDELRFNVQEKDGVTWIVDCYNASPEAVAASLQALDHFEGRKGAFLSALTELGSHSRKIHEEIAAIAVKHLDYVVCFGEDMKLLQTAFAEKGKDVLWAETRDEAALLLQEKMKAGDTILFKGSNSQKIWECLPCFSQ